jgi:glucosamine--fructose-6-phosphate aminotransferase (isomerizing)
MKLLRRLGNPLAVYVEENIFATVFSIHRIHFNAFLEDGEMAVIRLHKSMSVRKIKDDWLLIQGWF